MKKNKVPSKILSQFKIAFLLLLLLTIITGILYPLLITGLAQLLFPFEANGRLIFYNQKQVGSELIGQAFEDPKYFWGRPSATTPFPNNAMASNGSNLGPSNPALREAVNVRIKALHRADPQNNMPIPIDLITASASGLDPHISPKSAAYQIHRVAKARHFPEDLVRELINKYTEKRQFGFLGEPRVNVLKLNLALDTLLPKERD